MSDVPGPALTPEEVAYRRIMVERMKARHSMPALISFFLPGVGQMMKGSILKAFGIWAGVLVSWVLVAAGGIGFLTGGILWLWNVYDAYRSPES